MKLLGIDPGLAACGIALLSLQEPRPRVLSLEVVRTQPANKKRRLRAADDLTDRVRTIAEALHAAMWTGGDDIAALCVEGQVLFRKGAVRTSGVAALGRVRGLIDAFAVMRDLPVIEEGPQVLKLLVAGSRSASKQAVMDALVERFPEVAALWPRQKGLREHAADALAAAVAGLESDVVRAALRGANSIQEVM